MLHFMNALVALAMLHVSAPAAATGWPDMRKPGPIDIFGDWIAACDSSLTCSAVGLPAEGDPPGVFLRIGRAHGAPEASATLYFTQFAEDAGFPLPVGGRFPVTAFGRNGLLYSGSWILESPDEYSKSTLYYAVPPVADRTAFRDAIRRGDRLAIGYSSELTVSLAGSSDALLHLDIRQGVTGTPFALVAVGDNPVEPWQAWPPRPGNQLLHVSQFLRDLVPRPLPAGLPPPDDPACTDEAPISRALPQNGTLWATCTWRSNRNTMFRFWVERRGILTPAAFPAAISDVPLSDFRAAFPTPVDSEATWSELANPTFDHTLLTAFARARSHGDCGEVTGYQYEDGKGFALVYLATMPLCRGVPPEAWPVRLDIGGHPDGHEASDYGFGDYVPLVYPDHWSDPVLTVAAACIPGEGVADLSVTCSDAWTQSRLDRALQLYAAAIPLALDEDLIAERRHLLERLANAEDGSAILAEEVDALERLISQLLAGVDREWGADALARSCVPLVFSLRQELGCAVQTVEPLRVNASSDEGISPDAPAFILQTQVYFDESGRYDQPADQPIHIRGYVAVARVGEAQYRPVFAEVNARGEQGLTPVATPYGPAIVGEPWRGQLALRTAEGVRRLSTAPIRAALVARYGGDYMTDILWIDFETLEGTAYLTPLHPPYEDDPNRRLFFDVELKADALAIRFRD